MITVIGIPVYYHYCGGELEEISYVLKSNSCCGEEEDESEQASNDCCKDENRILKSNIDFTIKSQDDYTLVKTFSQVFYISLPFTTTNDHSSASLLSVYAKHPPANLQHSLVISTSVLRI